MSATRRVHGQALVRELLDDLVVEGAVAPAEHDLRAGPRQCLDLGPAEAAVAPGDQGATTFEAERLQHELLLWVHVGRDGRGRGRHLTTDSRARSSVSETAARIMSP